MIGAPIADGSTVESDAGDCVYEDERDYGDSAGITYVVLGPASGEQSLSEADGEIIGEDGGDVSGRAIAAAGDLDGDGLADLLIGAEGHCAGGDNAGAAYVVLGPATGATSLADADFKIFSSTRREYVGGSVAGAGDVNADGTSDLLIGTQRGGEAWLVSGYRSSTMDVDDANATFQDTAVGGLGYSVAGVRDVDGDDYDDILIGHPGDESGGHAAGGAFLALGPLTGGHDISDADIHFQSTVTYGDAGEAVIGLGDIDGDECVDLAINADHDGEAAEEAGALYVVLGGGSLLLAGLGCSR